MNEGFDTGGGEPDGRRPSAFGVLELHTTLAAVLIVAGLTVLAWFNRFVQDDAFISFRYARNLANGRGLVWNEGQRVEGYTNFLWTLLMVVPHRLNLDPVAFSMTVGLAAFILSLGLTYKLAALVLSSRQFALLAIVLLGTNYSFSAYATSGLETQLQTALGLGSVYLLSRALAMKTWSHRTSVGLSALLALSVLTRPDALLLAAIAMPVAAAFVWWKAGLSRREKLTSLGALIVPFVAVVSAFALWKLRYYGSLAPNSYYVKLATSVSYANGLRYVYAFLRAYWLFPIPLLLLWFSKALLRQAAGPMFVPVTFTIAWVAYVVHASGDFMEFRFLVPVLPYFYILTTWLIVVALRNRALQVALVALLLVGSFHHARTFVRTDDLDGIGFSASLLTPEGSNWIGVGKALNAAFGDDPEITIAVTAAGAVPYYSGLRTIDMLGINDAWVARHGRVLSSRPGHQRIATLDYLIESGTHLIIGHPLLVPMEAEYHYGRNAFKLFERLSEPIGSLDEIPDEAQALEIPIDAERKLVAIYIRRNPRIDEMIGRNGWRAESLKTGIAR